MAQLVTVLLCIRWLFQEGLVAWLESVFNDHKQWFLFFFLNCFYYTFLIKGSRGQRVSQSLEVKTWPSTFCGLPLTLLFPETSGLHSREAISRKPANLTTERNNSVPLIFLTLNSSNKGLWYPFGILFPFLELTQYRQFYHSHFTWKIYFPAVWSRYLAAFKTWGAL